MKYLCVLKNYTPKEKGDFFLLFEIKGNHYIIFRPELYRISCIEMSYLKEITPEELAIYTGVLPAEAQRTEDMLKAEDKEPEFLISSVCTKKQLLCYRFDIDLASFDENTHLFSSLVADDSGVLLYKYRKERVMIEHTPDLYTNQMFGDTGAKKVMRQRIVEKSFAVNEFLIKENCYIFDDKNCYTKFERKADVNNDLYVCFNAMDYIRRVEDPEFNGRLVLLCNGNPAVLSKALDEKFKINLIKPQVNEGGAYTYLETICFITNRNMKSQIFVPYHTPGEITIMITETEQLKHEHVIKITAIADEILAENYGVACKNLYSHGEIFDNVSQVTMRNSEFVIFAFIEALQQMQIEVINVL